MKRMVLATLLVIPVGPGCGDGGAKRDARVFADYNDHLDLGPLPYFREAGCGGDGWCGDGWRGDSGPGPAADMLLPDQMQPDMCIPPTHCNHTFSLKKGSESKAEVCGDFNSWCSGSSSGQMTLSAGTWTLTVRFKDKTRVTYKFRLDGKTWINDPSNPNITQDAYKNNYLDIACKNPCK